MRLKKEGVGKEVYIYYPYQARENGANQDLDLLHTPMVAIRKMLKTSLVIVVAGAAAWRAMLKRIQIWCPCHFRV